jgi:hypothetical protein
MPAKFIEQTDHSFHDHQIVYSSVLLETTPANPRTYFETLMAEIRKFESLLQFNPDPQSLRRACKSLVVCALLLDEAVDKLLREARKLRPRPLTSPVRTLLRRGC